MRAPLTFVFLLIAAACGAGARAQGAATSLTLTSGAFPHQGAIPAKYTCEGEDRSPPLDWSSPPAGTKSFALIVDDPDAPDPAAPQMTWVHWLLYNLPDGSPCSRRGYV